VNAVALRQAPETYRFPLTGQDIRSILVDGNPWFVGRDIAEALEYTNPRKAVRDHVPAGHRKGNESFPMADLGFHPQTILIDEAGMYRLIMRANTAQAEQFQEWVTAEVLPSIRRTGAYEGAPVQGTVPALAGLTPRDLARMILAEADRADAAEQRAAELAPRAEAWEALGEGGGSHSLRETGFILSQDPAIRRIGQNNVMRLIRDRGMVDDRGRPYARHTSHLVLKPVVYDHPRTGEPVLTTQLRVTPLGVAYLRRRLGGIGREVTA
jgi:anti-repressor protein